MSCNNDYNPCEECNQNPCYDDCGCLNPTTFDCITQPGIHQDLGITNDMNGKQVLEQINAVFAALTVDTPAPGNDVYVKATSSDTTSSFLTDKLVTGPYISKTILNPSGNEQIKLNVNLAAMISSDAGNELEIGTDNKLRVISTPTTNETYIVEGAGITVSGTGTNDDPFIISSNPSITALRTCFDGVWRDITVVATGTPDVTHVSGIPKYRIRHDGSIEFKGSATFNVNFGAYSASTRKRTITLGNIPTTCLTSDEQAGVADLKSMLYIDAPGTGDQITQQYGYIIRKSTQNIILEFQSSYIAAKTKTIVVNFDGTISHPTI